MADTTWPEGIQTILVCVDSYHHSILQGRFYTPLLQEEQHFESLSQLIIKLEKTLDGTVHPKSYTTIRTFSPYMEKPLPPSGVDYQDGKLASFALKILFRQNASWQGSITWLDENQALSFRSVLELIHLFDNALSHVPAS